MILWGKNHLQIRKLFNKVKQHRLCYYWNLWKRKEKTDDNLIKSKINLKKSPGFKRRSQLIQSEEARCNRIYSSINLNVTKSIPKLGQQWTKWRGQNSNISFTWDLCWYFDSNLIFPYYSKVNSSVFQRSWKPKEHPKAMASVTHKCTLKTIKVLYILTCTDACQLVLLCWMWERLSDKLKPQHCIKVNFYHPQQAKNGHASRHYQIGKSYRSVKPTGVWIEWVSFHKLTPIKPPAILISYIPEFRHFRH